MPTDRLGRPLRDLRVSVTDRCNFRCRYCMPRERFQGPDAFVPRRELLSFEEIARLVRVFTGLGVDKVRLTGGEPLLRRELDRLVGMVAGVEGVADVALTTNGSLLAEQAGALREAGLRRVTVSLDSVDPSTFAALSDTGVPLERVLEGIEAARDAGLDPVKVNAVVKRGVNDGGILDLARFGRRTGAVVRFIEYMDVGTTNGWRLDEVVPAREVVRHIHEAFPLEPVEPSRPGEVAERFRYRDGAGEVGVIASVTRPFCGACTRARLSPVGELFTCLFGAEGADLRGPLRSGASDARLEAAIRGVWEDRSDRYSELRRHSAPLGLPGRRTDKVEMSRIGG